MYKSLFPWAVGVNAGSLDDALKAAQIGGFQGVEIPVQEVVQIVETKGPDAANARFADAGILPSAWGLPVEWRGAEETWRKGLEELPRIAKAAQAIGCKRTSTWVLSGSDEREMAENRRFHIERFRPIAAILADYGCSLGLEFLGPKTLREGFKHPFIYKMQDMLELGAQIGPNVGLLLDCWHWYTSGGTVADLSALRPEQVVYVHVNDAPAGIPIDEQVDNKRCIPGETGMIDIASFLRTLQAIGYVGPVTPEPFSAELNALPTETDRLKAIGAAMDKIFAQAGVIPKAVAG